MSLVFIGENPSVIFSLIHEIEKQCFYVSDLLLNIKSPGLDAKALIEARNALRKATGVRKNRALARRMLLANITRERLAEGQAVFGETTLYQHQMEAVRKAAVADGFLLLQSAEEFIEAVRACIDGMTVMSNYASTAKSTAQKHLEECAHWFDTRRYPHRPDFQTHICHQCYRDPAKCRVFLRDTAEQFQMVVASL